MPRKARVTDVNAYYHVYNRTNDGRKLFDLQGVSDLFLQCLAEAQDAFNTSLLSYCLMPNHYHLCLYTPQNVLSEMMRSLLTRFVQCYHKRSEGYGHLFQGRFKSIYLKDEQSVRNVIVYIENNPLEAGIVSDPADYSHSSYRELIGLTSKLKLISRTRCLSFFGKTQEKALSEFMRNLRNKEGVRVMRKALEDTTLQELSFENESHARPSLKELFDDVSSTWEMRKRAMLAVSTHKYSQSEVARESGLSQSTVSRLLRKNRDE